MINRFGQVISPGDFVLRGSSNYMDLYIVDKFSSEDRVAHLVRFGLKIKHWVYDDHVMGNGHYEELIPPVVITQRTRTSHPKSLFRIPLEAYISLDPLIYEAFLEARRKVLNGEKI